MPSLKKHSFALISTGLAALALGACSSHPSLFPSGYVYHNMPFKSANPPESTAVSPVARRYMGPEQAEQFRSAVYDLVTRLTDNAGLPPAPIYVLAPRPMTAFYGNIDNDLRESLRHLGYVLSDIPEGAYIFTYSADLLPVPAIPMAPEGVLAAPAVAPYPGVPVVAPAVIASAPAPNVIVALQVYDGLGPTARMLTEVSGQYFIQGAEALYIPSADYRYVPAGPVADTVVAPVPIPAPVLVEPPLAPVVTSGPAVITPPPPASYTMSVPAPAPTAPPPVEAFAPPAPRSDTTYMNRKERRSAYIPVEPVPAVVAPVPEPDFVVRAPAPLPEKSITPPAPSGDTTYMNRKERRSAYIPVDTAPVTTIAPVPQPAYGVSALPVPAYELPEGTSTHLVVPSPAVALPVPSAPLPAAPEAVIRYRD